MTGFEDPQVERGYRRLQSDYDEAVRRVGDVRKRIQDVETVAKDLFTEWEKENREIGTDSLRQVSRRQLGETRERYEEMIVLLKKVERSMDPVLRKLHDYVLTLKHNLNAQAIASLKGESARIETDIGGLIRDMNVAIEQADAFVRQMPK
jgi:hypothetical protein